jgi:hypothetical protein
VKFVFEGETMVWKEITEVVFCELVNPFDSPYE